MLIDYNRIEAKKYAKKWAFSRNPKYYAFDNVGGDCTNFVSQCLLAGSKIMNYTPNIGWYYIDSVKRTPSWTSVEFLYEFLTTNKGNGPFAKIVHSSDTNIGDIVQLGNEQKFYHSLFIVGKTSNNIYVASHDFDTYMKNLKLYTYDKIRFLHIEGVRVL